MKKDQILTALLKISKDLDELKRSVQTLRGVSKKRTIPRRENPKNQSRIFSNKEARALTTKLFREGVSYDEIKQRLLSELNFPISRSAISRFYRRLLKDSNGKTKRFTSH